VLGGSEDGNLYVWDARSGELLDRLAGHKGVVTHVEWSKSQSLAVTASHDGTVRTWWQDTSKEDMV
jgi:COMPASS component SWD3